MMKKEGRQKSSNKNCENNRTVYKKFNNKLRRALQKTKRKATEMTKNI